MSKRTRPFDPLSFLGVLLPGVLGLLILGRTLTLYLGHDPLAVLLIVVMTAALTLGLCELLVRTRRAGALRSEVLGLPDVPTDDHIEFASPVLRSLLRARLDNAPPAPLHHSVTPYLGGLLVMLGLLGTLLGLFETLGGAGQALTASTDIKALRDGLSQPVRGLTRSFGCSAAGIGASAMLGLSAAIVRRLEGRAFAAAHSYASGPLRRLSPVRLQLAALEQLAQQGQALPKAAGQLERAIEQLGAVAEGFREAQATFSKNQLEGLERTVSKLGGELGKVPSELAQAIREGVLPAVEKSVSRSSAAAAREVQGTQRALTDLATRLAQSERERREEDERQLARLGALVEQTVARLDAAQVQQVETTGHSIRELTRSAGEADATRRELDAAHGQRMAELIQETMVQAKTALAEQSETARGLVAELGERLGQAEQARRGQAEQEAQRLLQLGEALSTLLAKVDQDLSERRESERALAQRAENAVDALTSAARSASQFDALAQQLTDKGAQELSRVAEAAEASLAKGTGVLEAALSSHRDHADALLEQSSERWAVLSASTQEGARDAIRHMTELSDAQAERFSALQNELLKHRSEHAEQLAGQLTAHAERLGQGLDGTGQVVREAADLLKASAAELGLVTESFAKSIERQREAARTWLETLGELDGAIERAGRGAAAEALGDHLASTQEVFARQLQFQRELFEQLQGLRSSPSARKASPDVSA